MKKLFVKNFEIQHFGVCQLIGVWTYVKSVILRNVIPSLHKNVLFQNSYIPLLHSTCSLWYLVTSN